MFKKMMGMMLAVSLILTAAGTGSASAAEGSGETRATWLWNPWMLVKDEAAALAFLENKQVNKVYLQIDRDVPNAVYQSFIAKAKIKGMGIYALDGAPSWVAPKGQASLDSLMAWLSSYQTQAPAQAKFAGIHLDVEPYLYSGWNSKRAATVKAYQTLLQNAGASAFKLGLPLEADMPFWFDEITYKNTFGSGLLAEWVIANTHSVTLMAYRDSAPMIIDIAKNEMAMAAKYGKTIVIGVETGVTDEGSIITFAEEGEAYMNRELAVVTTHYSGSPAYQGVAVHHVGSWMTLKP